MRHLVTIQKIIELFPIENADNIEVAQIKDWKIVVKKNEFKKDDLVLYYEIDSFLPVRPEYDFLLKGTKIRKMIFNNTEREGIRLKTIRLRGQISQGLILPISVLNRYGNFEIKEGADVSEQLDVIKWEPPIPACIAGEVKGKFPSFLPKTDEERIQNCGHLLETFRGHEFYITSKLDGTSATFYKYNGEFGVCSRNLELKRNVDNVFWKIAKQYNIEENLPDGFCIQGEIVGEKIQENRLKIKGHKLYVFNVYNIKEGHFLDFKFFKNFALGLGLETVPILEDDFILNHDVEQILQLADAKSPFGDFWQEGIVVRPTSEKLATIGGVFTRLSFKAISNEYLLKYGG